MLPDRDLLALMRELDDPDAPEWPKGFDNAAAEVQWHRLVAHLEAVFLSTPGVGGISQDAAFHRMAIIDASATSSGLTIEIRMSRFGGLIAAGLLCPSHLTEEEPDWEPGPVHPDDVRRIDEAATVAGCMYVPEHLVNAHYDGPTPLVYEGPAPEGLEPEPPTWYLRYFDWQ